MTPTRRRIILLLGAALVAALVALLLPLPAPRRPGGSSEDQPPAPLTAIGPPTLDSERLSKAELAKPQEPAAEAVHDIESPVDGRPASPGLFTRPPTELELRLKAGLPTAELALELGKFSAADWREKLALLVAANRSGDPALAAPLAAVRAELGTVDGEAGRIRYSTYIRTTGSLLRSKKWKQTGVPEEFTRDRVRLARAYLDAIAELVRIAAADIDESQWAAYANSHELLIRTWPHFSRELAAAEERRKASDALTDFMRRIVEGPVVPSRPLSWVVELAGLLGDESTADALLVVARNADRLVRSKDGVDSRTRRVHTFIQFVQTAVVRCGGLSHREELARILLVRLAGPEDDPEARMSYWSSVAALAAPGMPDSLVDLLGASVRGEREERRAGQIREKIELPVRAR